MIDARDELAAILVAAYSGEQAAALAYRGHWRSCVEPDEREAIQRIEDDEWRHRRILGQMLERLGKGPSPRREVRSRIVGRVLGLLCSLAGRRLPMLAAGRLERGNVCAYDEAASLAEAGNLPEMVGELREMAEVEREHERYFRAKVAGRPASLARKVAALRETTPEVIGTSPSAPTPAFSGARSDVVRV